MLHSLDALAGKLSPGGGGTGTGNADRMLDTNANRVHPYGKRDGGGGAANSNTSLVMSNNNNNTAQTINNNNNNNNCSSANNNLLAAAAQEQRSTATPGGGAVPGSDAQLQLQQQEQPDPDTIKMFVGQVPRSMDESDLRRMFEEYGRVHSINVLRDKTTGASKGCCFVTFFTRKAALLAQDALHNVKTLNGMHHPIQMKPADSENRNERKLFVGMLSKRLNEADVRAMFQGHGVVEECTVLRDAAGNSRGCAFVTFATRQAAALAIKHLHQTMEGCSAPLVVKFADTQREKEQKRQQQLQATMWGALAPALASPPHQYSSVIPTAATANETAQLQLLQAMGGSAAALQLQQQLLAGSDGLLAPIGVQNLVTLAAMSQPTSAASPLCVAAANLLGKGAAPAAAQEARAPGLGLGAAPELAAYGSLITSATINAAAIAAAGKQIEGPEGCNLFIYHLPQEFTDTDLASTFLPFGPVISAKVFIDKQTNLSKCFGFVSFDNAASAQQAISAMNGFQIGTKRLKVQLKRAKEQKPY